VGDLIAAFVELVTQMNGVKPSRFITLHILRVAHTWEKKAKRAARLVVVFY
jgi:hypothetical protein